MSTVYANGRSILHAGDGLAQTAAAPDVCKTPSPGGPVPIPYVNVASDGDLAKGTKKITIEGKSVALESANLSTSTGDEPGTAGGGLVSSKTKGKLTWGTASADVKFEGKGVVRFMDVTQHNGNSFNTAFTALGGTGFAYGDDFEGECPICGKDSEKHAAPELIRGSLEIANAILEELTQCEENWRTASQRAEGATTKLNKEKDTNSQMKPETIASRQAQIAALERERDALAGHRRANSSGYMFGVMVCLTGKKFAAVSGNEVPESFRAIATRQGCTIIEDAATCDDFTAINPRCAAGDASALAKVKENWNKTMDNHVSRVSGYNNHPGTCAGAKLIGRSGHVAQSLTEIFFSFTGGKKALTFNVGYRGPSEFAPTSGPWTVPTAADVAQASSPNIRDRRDMRRKKEQTVPSCQSCQDTLFMARCDLEKQSCG